MENLPYSLEAEQSIIGSILVDGNVITYYFLDPDDFYFKNYATIYQAMTKLYKENNPIDIVSVAEELRKIDKLVEIGGTTYLMKLAGSIATPVNMTYYAKVVKQKSIARQIFAKAVEIQEFALEEDLDGAHKKANEILYLNTKDDIPISEMFTEEDLERLTHSKRFTSSRLEKLTHFVWFMRKEVIYIAGRTSTGKSQLAINLALDFLQQNAKVGYLSFELGKEQLLKRLISFDSSIHLSEIDIRQKEWFDFGQNLLSQGVFKNLYFRDDIFDINEVFGWIESHDLDVVFLDYLQMMHDKTFRGNRNEEIGNIARELRRMSNKRCIVALSQFNRREGEDENEIDLSRIRDSGEIEQTATSVILIRKKKDTEDQFYYAVAKNQTNGRLTHGWIELEFLPGGKFKEAKEE